MPPIADFIVNLLFPRRCPWCDTVLGFAKSCACQDDVDALLLPGCQLPAPDLGPEGFALDGVWACYVYKEPVRSSILRMKFENGRNLAVPVGEKLAERFDSCGLAEKVDCIVPVPVSAGTQRQRGYNQSALLAWELSRHCSLPCLPNALRKTRETVAQSELGRAERLTNVNNAYIAEPGDVKGKRVLLVDDIFTTGSTLNECAKTLRAAGATGVVGLCVAASELSVGGHGELEPA